MNKSESKILANNELEKRIMDAFEVFDHSGKQSVDVREIATILRSLGCCPSEAEIQEVILASENQEATGSVLLARFLPFMCAAITEGRFRPASADTLLTAFRYFDPDGRGFLDKERFVRLMTEEGEPLSQEELEEALQVAVDPVTDNINYEFYINQLLVVPTETYSIAEREEQERLAELAAQPQKRRASSLLREAGAAAH